MSCNYFNLAEIAAKSALRELVLFDLISLFLCRLRPSILCRHLSNVCPFACICFLWPNANIFALAYINLNFNLKLRQSSGKNYTNTQNMDAYRMWPRIIPMPCVCLKLGMLLHNLGGKSVTTTADAQSLSWKPLRQSHAHFTLALAGFC